MSETLAAEFISYYNDLTQVNGVCCVFERNDKYCSYGFDAKLIVKILTSVKLKVLEAGGESLNYVSMTKGHFISVLRNLLFIKQYKVKILRNFGPGKNNWKPVGEASPGNLTSVEDLLIDDNSYAMPQRGLLAVKITNEGAERIVGVTFCDPILREFQMSQFVDNPQLSTLQSVFAQLSPQECLLPVTKSKRNDPSKSVVAEMLKWHNISKTETEFTDLFVISDLNKLLQLGEDQAFQNACVEACRMKVAHHSMGAVLKYLGLISDESNYGQFVLSIFKSELFAKVDLSCELGLGLFPEMKSDFHLKTYLFGFLNSCFTGAGQRLLIQWIKQPLMDVRKIEERLDVVQMFVEGHTSRGRITKIVSEFTDIEMLCRKIQRRKAGLQDLYKIYEMLQKLPLLVRAFREGRVPHGSVRELFVFDFEDIISDCEKYVSMISQTLDFDAIKNREFVVKAEYDVELTDIREQLTGFKTKMDGELNKVKNDLGISTVKLEIFEKIGFAFRLTLKEECHVRNKKGYDTIDTRSSGVRFQTPILKENNERYCNLRKKYEHAQKQIVENMVEVSASYIKPLRLLSSKIAWLDAALSLTRAALKTSKRYVRPILREKGECHIVLKDCRHPFIEDKVRDYIPNDVEITKDKQRFYLVTGPNMGGKSTYIRSIALNVLLAQMGSFVPCSAAEISVVDAFFTRIGASDNPSKAMSTFMYEMLEMKNMICNSTSDSLLIIDEMGRGTSTYDGFGLSWAISRRIAEKIKPPCLFATHFHDLTTLSDTIPSIGNLHVDAVCTDTKVTFLYRVKSGVCNESFGIHVAKLALFPSEAIEDAEKKLKELEESCISLDSIVAKFAGLPHGDEFIQTIKDAFPGSAFRPKKKQKTETDEPMDIDELNDEKSKSTPKTPTLIENFQSSQRLLNILEDMEKKLHYS